MRLRVVRSGKRSGAELDVLVCGAARLVSGAGSTPAGSPEPLCLPSCSPFLSFGSASPSPPLVRRPKPLSLGGAGPPALANPEVVPFASSAMETASPSLTEEDLTEVKKDVSSSREWGGERARRAETRSLSSGRKRICGLQQRKVRTPPERGERGERRVRGTWMDAGDPVCPSALHPRGLTR